MGSGTPTCARRVSSKTVIKEQYKMDYDKKARERKFEVGDLVLVRDHNKMQGFKRELSGPYTILEVLPRDNYKLHMPDNPCRHSRFHVNMLDKYITPTSECMLTEGEAVELGPQIPGSDEGSIPETEIYLEREDRKRLKRLVDEFQDVFKAKPGRTETAHIEIKTGDAYPVHLPAYRVPPAKLPQLEQEIKTLLEDII